MLEKSIERRLVDGVKSVGGKAYKFISPGSPGAPDRIVVLPGGVVMFVELKTKNGKLSAYQEMRIAELRNLNVDVYVLNGKAEVDWFLGVVKEKCRGL